MPSKRFLELWEVVEQFGKEGGRVEVRGEAEEVLDAREALAGHSELGDKVTATHSAHQEQ